MQAFTKARDEATADELWFVEHPPVFTLGLAAKPEHVLDAGPIPVVRIDRGGQVTWHGPGQLVAYVLLDLRRAGVRREGAGAPPRAVGDRPARRLRHRAASARRACRASTSRGAKIAAVGLRVSRGCSFHGIALNVDADLAAFARINPCGYPGLAATRLADLGVRDTIDCSAAALAGDLARAPARRLRPPCPTPAPPTPSSTPSAPGRPRASRSRSSRPSPCASPSGSACARAAASASTRSSGSCATRSSTPSARKPPAPTSASASGTARRPS